MDLDRPYWNMEIEPKLNTPEMRQMQNDLLVKNIGAMYERIPLNKKRMDEAGVKPSDIKSLDDLSKIPVYGQPEMRQLLGEIGFDMKKILTMLMGDMADDVYVMAATSGTTGMPTPYPVVRSGLPMMREMNNRMLWRCGIRPGHKLVLAFGLSMFLAGAPTLLTLEEFPGITIIPVGAEAGTARIINFTRLFGGDVLMCTPSLALHLIERAPEVMGEGVRALGIKILLCGAEPGAGIPEVRKRIETEYGAKLFDAGAGAGVSCDYPEYQGMHWIADDMAYYELVNPETGASVPLEDGATGLAAFTTLGTHGSGILGLRMTLGDIHQVFTSPCPCGKSGFRYKVIGRTDDMLKVKGVMVYPAQIKNVVESFIPRTTGEFRIMLDEPPPRVVPPLKLKVEYGEGVKEGAGLEQLTAELQERMHQHVKIRPEIHWVEPFSLERSDKKTQYIEKLYEKKEGGIRQ
jgi:phenylacetate-CoA ligase